MLLLHTCSATVIGDRQYVIGGGWTNTEVTVQCIGSGAIKVLDIYTKLMRLAAGYGVEQVQT